jgi:hypothetical protein
VPLEQVIVDFVSTGVAKITGDAEQIESDLRKVESAAEKAETAAQSAKVAAKDLAEAAKDARERVDRIASKASEVQGVFDAAARFSENVGGDPSFFEGVGRVISGGVEGASAGAFAGMLFGPKGAVVGGAGGAILGVGSEVVRLLSDEDKDDVATRVVDQIRARERIEGSRTRALLRERAGVRGSL